MTTTRNGAPVSAHTIIYRRENTNWLSSHAKDKSLTYWRCAARDIFSRYPSVTLIEVVRSGRKTDSSLLARGEDYPARDQYVIVASTGGKWGKSRRDFAPQSVIDECVADLPAEELT